MVELYYEIEKELSDESHQLSVLTEFIEDSGLTQEFLQYMSEWVKKLNGDTDE